jgi:hypothetical protein
MSRCVPTFLVSVLVFLVCARAQDGMPTPAPELKKLEPLIGNWTGSGKMSEPSGEVTEWKARGSYRWCLDGHFVQEDFAIAFTGMAAPLTFRGYVGWDRENQRYVNINANNGGQVQLHEMKFLPDGTMLQIMVQNQQGLPYAERSLFKIDGDSLTHTIDLLMPQGASMTIVDGKFTRGGDALAMAWDGPTWMDAKPHESIARLCKSAGAYDSAGEMVMAPGAPKTKFGGTDTFRAVFGGTVLLGTTEGAAEGIPGKYIGELMYGYSPVRGCIVGIYVDNFGSVMTMDAYWSADGQLIAMTSALFQGQPTVQRSLLSFDASGAVTTAVSHTIVGTAPPFESYRATHTKKK